MAKPPLWTASASYMADWRSRAGSSYCYQRAIGIYRELADRFNEADTLVNFGDLWSRAGDSEAARRSWADALAIFDEIGHPDGDEVRARLDGTGRPPAG